MRSLIGTLERRPVIGIFVGALLLRALVAIVITLATDGVVAPDEAIFRWMAATVARGGDIESGDYGPTYQVTRFYILLLAAGYELFGPHLIVGRLLAAVLGAAAAAATVAVTRQVTGNGPAMLAGAIVAMLPSQVFFSAQTLKDPLVWLLVATIALAMSRAATAGLRTVWKHLLVVATGLALLGMVRSQTTAVVAIAIALAGWTQGQEREQLVRGVAAAVVAVVVPGFVGLGPLATRIISQAADTASIRTRHALAGETAFADPDAGTVEQLVLGLRAYLVEPLPWRATTASWEPLAQAETVLWYPIVAMAFVGLWAARRHVPVLAFPVLYAGGTTLVYVLAEGDLMTAYRHRGEIVWVSAVLVAVAVERWGPRRDKAAAEHRASMEGSIGR